MPLFARHDPDIRSLIAYVVARSREREITLTQTKLVKLLYLIDVERIAEQSKPITGLRWVFYHYGPYALELPEILEPMEGRQLIVTPFKDAKLYRAAPDAPKGDDWPSGTRRVVDGVIRHYAGLELNELLDHVYFHTAPMIAAVRGEPLNMERARTDPPPRAHAPLPAPSFSEDDRQRIRAGLGRQTLGRIPMAADQRRPLFSDPVDEALDLDDAHGKLAIRGDAEA